MFSRLGKLIKGFFYMFLNNLEAANPRALLEAEILAMQEAVSVYNKGLAQQAAMVARLNNLQTRQKANLEKQKARIAALLKAGRTDEAGRLALEAKSLSQLVAENQTQHALADKTYVAMNKQRDVYVREAYRRIEAIKGKLTRAEVAESQAKLAEIATFDMAGSGATLERLEASTDDRVAQARGRARVAADSVAGGAWNHHAEEESALEQAALSEFTKEERRAIAIDD